MRFGLKMTRNKLCLRHHSSHINNNFACLMPEASHMSRCDPCGVEDMLLSFNPT